MGKIINAPAGTGSVTHSQTCSFMIQYDSDRLEHPLTVTADFLKKINVQFNQYSLYSSPSDQLKILDNWLILHIQILNGQKKN